MYDQNIVRRVMQGDPEAFSKMYADCSRAVYRRANDLLQDPAMAREAVRKTFLDIHLYAGQLKHPSDFDEWVYRLVNYHADRIKSTNKLWDQPDLQIVWDELNVVVNTPEQTNKSEENTTESWQPILFPPDEPLDEEEGGVGAMPWGALSTDSHLQPDEDGQDAEDSSAIDLMPQDVQAAKPKRNTNKSGKRSHRVRFEPANARPPRYSIERVPYDYLPYEDSSQAAYDQVRLDEAPRGVYEHIPYSRETSGGGNVVQSIPYEGPQAKHRRAAEESLPIENVEDIQRQEIPLDREDKQKDAYAEFRSTSIRPNGNVYADADSLEQHDNYNVQHLLSQVRDEYLHDIDDPADLGRPAENGSDAAENAIATDPLEEVAFAVAFDDSLADDGFMEEKYNQSLSREAAAVDFRVKDEELEEPAVLETASANPTVIAASGVKSYTKKKRRATAGTGFFIAILAAIGVLVWLGIRFGII